MKMSSIAYRISPVKKKINSIRMVRAMVKKGKPITGIDSFFMLQNVKEK